MSRRVDIDVIPTPTINPDNITLCIESQTYLPYTFQNNEDFSDYRFNLISSTTGEDYLQASNHVFIAKKEGIYTYEVSAIHIASGCMAEQEVTIEVGKTFDLDMENNINICAGESAILGTNFIGSVPIGSYEYKVLINNQEVDAYDYLDNPYDSTPIFTMPYEGGFYKVQLTITDNTCVSNTIDINISDDKVYLEDLRICEGSQTNLADYLNICTPNPALTLAHWDFSGLSNNTGSILSNNDLIPTTANANNSTQVVQLRHIDDVPEVDEDKNIYFDNDKNALYATHWDKAQGDLADMEKFWYVTINSTDFKDLQVFVEQSGQARAPRDFDLEYSLDFERWEKIADGQPMTDTDANVFKTTFDEVFLPEACDNQTILYIRFLREHNPTQSISGQTVKYAHKSYIRDIHITGRAIEPTIPNYTYNWQVNTLPISDVQSPNPIVTASQIGTYATSVTVYDETGNQYGTASGSISVTASSNQMTASPQQTQICPGETLAINLSGADNYTWEASTTNGISVTPNGSFSNSTATLQQAVSMSATGEITYTIQGFFNNSDCVLTKIVTITVEGSNNTFQSTPNLSNVCVEESVIIPLSGADSYTWELETSNNSGVYPNSYDYSGTVNTSTGTIEEDFGDIIGNGGAITYRITGYFTNDCPVVNTVVMNVLPTPTLSLSPSHQNVCPNESFTIIIEDFEANIDYDWTVNLPNGITGLSGGIANNENITLSLGNISNSNHTVTYTITATITSNIAPNTFCSVSQTVTVEVINGPETGCDAEKGLIVNEIGVGANLKTPFVELMVKSNSNCDLVDIRHFILDDNNGDFSNTFNGSNVSQGHIRFKNIPRWAAVDPYALIVIYDDNAHPSSTTPIPADDPDDTNPHDGVYVLPISDSGLEKHVFAPNFVTVGNNNIQNSAYTPPSYYETANGDWDYIDLDPAGDAMQVRNPDGTYYHGISYGGSPIIGGPDDLLIEGLNGWGKTYGFKPNTPLTGDYFEGDEFRYKTYFEVNTGLETPGAFNSTGNENFAQMMTEGCFNGYIKKKEPSNTNLLWTVYPNPSNSSFTIELQLSTDLTTDLRIFDITGKEMLKIYEHSTLAKGLYPVKVNGEQLPAGVYICQLKYTDETGQEHRDYLKLVKTQ